MGREGFSGEKDTVHEEGEGDQCRGMKMCHHTRCPQKVKDSNPIATLGRHMGQKYRHGKSQIRQS